MITVVVSAAIFDDQHRILCVKQNYGDDHWALPGGGVEPGEPPTTALEREVREESGYRCRIGHLIGVYSAPWKDSLGLLFRADVAERDDWAPNAEITEVGFFPSDDLPQPMTTRMQARIRDAFDGQRGVVRTFPTEER